MIESFVRNPVKVLVGVILVALFGGIALYNMPIQLTPDVEIPTITVETRWPGASPQEVEKEIVQEQEEQLQSVEGLQKLTSESMDSMGRVILEFDVDADMNKALLMVSTRLQQVPEYPEDADEPVIATSNTSERWVAWFILNLRPPTNDKIDAFAAKHPQLAQPLETAKLTTNASLKMFRLQELRKSIRKSTRFSLRIKTLRRCAGSAKTLSKRGLNASKAYQTPTSSAAVKKKCRSSSNRNCSPKPG
ncbi:MAG: efflux RND transporter permease subunit [Pirellulales bacterium]